MNARPIKVAERMHGEEWILLVSTNATAWFQNVFKNIDFFKALPRHTPLHNLLDLLDGSRHTGISVPLQRIRSLALSPPHQQQLEQLKVLSSLGEAQPPWTRPPHSRGPLSMGGEAQRRSRQAKRRADKMRRVYKEGGREGEGLTTPLSGEKREEEEEREEEIDDLYQWTQKLSFDDIR